MGGQRHKGISYNRAKKKKVTFAAPVEDEVSSAEGSEDDAPRPVPEPEPPAAAPVPNAPALTMDRAGLAVARKQMLAAEKHYQLIKRRWERKKSTYFNYDKYSPWAEQSVVKRIMSRLQQADDQLDAARAQWIFRRQVWLRLRSWLALSKLKDAPILERLMWLRAGVRLYRECLASRPDAPSDGTGRPVCEPQRCEHH